MVVYYCSIVIIIVTNTISLPLISTWFRSTTNLNHVHYHQPKPCVPGSRKTAILPSRCQMKKK